MEGRTKEFQKLLTNHLRNYESDPDLKIDTFSKTSGCERGINFMSEITRLTVVGTLGDGRDYRKTFIMKQPLTDLVMSQNFQAEEAFNNELRVYRTLLPLMQDKDHSPWPKLIAADKEYLILEDLITAGFVMPKRNKNDLDLDHCQLVVKEIALFHAKSVLLKLSERSKFDDVCKHIRHIVFSENGRKHFSEMLEISLARALDSYRHRIGNGPTKILDALEIFKGKIFDIMYAMTEPKDDFGVLCHGDLWMNNLMFKYDAQGKVNELRFLDFQATSLAHPCTDLLRFVYTSTSSNIRSKHLNQLLELYHRTLIGVLINSSAKNDEDIQKFSKDFNYDEFLKEFYKRSLYGLITAFWLLPVLTMDPSADLFASKFEENSKLGQNENLHLIKQIEEADDGLAGKADFPAEGEVYCNEGYHHKVHELMEEFSENGWIDEVEINFENR